jgi:hypothetical protein
LYAIIDPEAITTMITLNAWIWSRRTNLRAVNRCNEKKIYPTIQHGSAKGTTETISIYCNETIYSRKASCGVESGNRY